MDAPATRQRSHPHPQHRFPLTPLHADATHASVTTTRSEGRGRRNHCDRVLHCLGFPHTGMSNHTLTTTKRQRNTVPIKIRRSQPPTKTLTTPGEMLHFPQPNTLRGADHWDSPHPSPPPRRTFLLPKMYKPIHPLPTLLEDLIAGVCVFLVFCCFARCRWWWFGVDKEL